MAGSINEMEEVIAAKNNSMKKNVEIILPKSIAPKAIGSV